MDRLYNVITYGRGDLIMIAPLAVIQKVFQLHQAAVDRVLKETQEHGTSCLHFNGRIVAGLSGPIVVEAKSSAAEAAIRRDLGEVG